MRGLWGAMGVMGGEGHETTMVVGFAVFCLSLYVCVVLRSENEFFW